MYKNYEMEKSLYYHIVSGIQPVEIARYDT